MEDSNNINSSWAQMSEEKPSKSRARRGKGSNLSARLQPDFDPKNLASGNSIDVKPSSNQDLDPKTMDFDKLVEFLNPAFMLDYLQKILSFLKSNKTEFGFPNIAPFKEAFLVKLAQDKSHLMCRGFKDMTRTIAHQILDVLRANKDVYIWTYKYESERITKSLLVYKKLYIKETRHLKTSENSKTNSYKDTATSPKTLASSLENLDLNQLPTETRQETSLTTAFKIKMLNITLKFLKDDSLQTLECPEMALHEIEFMYSLLNDPDKNTDIGFGFKSLYAPLFNAIQVFNGKYELKMSLLKTCSVATARLLLQKTPKSKADTNLNSTRQCQKGTDLNMSLTSNSSSDILSESSRNLTRAQRDILTKQNLIRSLPKSFILASLELILNFISDDSLEANHSFTDIESNESRFLQCVTSIARTAECYQLFSEDCLALLKKISRSYKGSAWTLQVEEGKLNKRTGRRNMSLYKVPTSDKGLSSRSLPTKLEKMRNALFMDSAETSKNRFESNNHRIQTQRATMSYQSTGAGYVDNSKDGTERSSSKDRRGSSKDRRGSSKERRGSSKDRRRSSRDRRGSSRDKRENSRERRANSKDGRASSKDRKTSSKERRASSRDWRENSRDRRENSRDRRTSSKERRAGSRDRRENSRDRRASSKTRKASKDRRENSTGRRGNSRDWRGSSRDRRGSSRDRRGSSRDKRERSREKRERSREKRASSRDKRGSSRDRGARSKDRRARSKDRGAERRMESNRAERSVPHKISISFQSAGAQVIDNANPTAEREATRGRERVVEGGRGKEGVRKTKLLEALSTPMECDRAERMMRLMGWEGGALGARGEGIIEPIMPALHISPGAGLGHVKAISRSTADFRVQFLKATLEMLQSDQKETTITYAQALTKREGRFIMPTITAFNARKPLGLHREEEVRLVLRIMKEMITDQQLLICCSCSNDRRELFLKKTKGVVPTPRTGRRKKRSKSKADVSIQNVEEDSSPAGRPSELLSSDHVLDLNEYYGLERSCPTTKTAISLAYRIVFLEKIKEFLQTDTSEKEFVLECVLNTKQKNYIQGVITNVNARRDGKGRYNSGIEHDLYREIRDVAGDCYMVVVFSTNKFVLKKKYYQKRFTNSSLADLPPPKSRDVKNTIIYKNNIPVSNYNSNDDDDNHDDENVFITPKEKAILITDSDDDSVSEMIIDTTKKTNQEADITDNDSNCNDLSKAMDVSNESLFLGILERLDVLEQEEDNASEGNPQTDTEFEHSYMSDPDIISKDAMDKVGKLSQDIYHVNNGIENEIKQLETAIRKADVDFNIYNNVVPDNIRAEGFYDERFENISDLFGDDEYKEPSCSTNQNGELADLKEETEVRRRSTGDIPTRDQLKEPISPIHKFYSKLEKDKNDDKGSTEYLSTDDQLKDTVTPINRHNTELVELKKESSHHVRIEEVNNNHNKVVNERDESVVEKDLSNNAEATVSTHITLGEESGFQDVIVENEITKLSPASSKRSRSDEDDDTEQQILKKYKIEHVKHVRLLPGDTKNITTDIVQKVQLLISKTIDNSTFLPLLQCHGIQNGGLVYGCHNEETLLWLKDVIYNDCELNLKVAETEFIEDETRKVLIKMCSLKDDVDKLFSRLEMYNPALDTSDWKVMDIKTNVDCVLLTVLVDINSFNFITESNFSLFAGIDKALFTVVWE